MTNKRLLTIVLIAALITCSSMVWAQQSESADAVEKTLAEQIEEARMELAEAAQRMARLQHQLVRSQSDLPAPDLRELEELEFDFKFDQEFDRFPVREIVFASFPPRIGVLLGSPGSEEENLVVGVTPGSGAERSGIRRGDRLISVNGHDVTSDTGARIRELLPDFKTGDTVDVVVARGDDTELVMPVTLGTELSSLSNLTQRLKPAMENIERNIVLFHSHDDDRPGRPVSPRMLGLGRDSYLVSNHDGLAPYFGTEEGVIVLRIDPDNPLNLESGDVILSIDGETISRPIDLGRVLLHREAGEQITIQLMRRGLVTELFGHIPDQTQPRIGAIRFAAPFGG